MIGTHPKQRRHITVKFTVQIKLCNYGVLGRSDVDLSMVEISVLKCPGNEFSNSFSNL